MLNTVFGWWLELFQGNWAISGTVVGVLLGLVIAAFVVLLAGCVVVWTLAGLKAVGHAFMVGFRGDRTPADARSDEADRRDQLTRLAVDMRAVAESPKD